MKKILLKGIFKEIIKSYRRFISILLMALLGVGFFVGIRAASPNMKYRLDEYFDAMNVFDIKVIGTMGLTNDDLTYVKDLAEVKEAYGVFDKEVIFIKDNNEYVLNMRAYNSAINQISLSAGNLPQSENECVIEARFSLDLGIKIGDTIEIDEALIGDDEASFKNHQLTVVGIVSSPLYISNDRGSTKLGSGGIDYYVYYMEDNYQADLYTAIYITLSGAKDLSITNSTYDDLVAFGGDQIKAISGIRQQARYDSLKAEALNKIEDAEKELTDQKTKFKKEMTKAEKKIKNSQKEITAGKKAIKTNKVTADQELAQAEKLLQENEAEYNLKKQAGQNYLTALNQQNESLAHQLEQINLAIDAIKAGYELADEATKNILDQELATLEQNKLEILTGLQMLKATIKTLNDELVEGKNKLEIAKKEFDKKKKQVSAEFQAAEKKLVNAQNELDKAQEKLAKTKKEVTNEINEAEEKIIDAKTDVRDLEQPKWYVLNRLEANAGYRSLMQDSESINNIGKVFPLLFFVVAALMSLTSMTRMIDEQRTEIGTLKALGYSKLQISSKYIVFSLLATLIGSVIGTCLGYAIIPPIIITAYLTLYDLPNAAIIYDFSQILLGTIVIIFCIVGGAIFSSHRKLKYEPAKLMRPKAPKAGKRVFVERITFIWQRLTFFHKVTLRNIFRYKQRFLMTVIGIGGATALIVVGFGIKNSVAAIATTQFKDIYTYQISIGLKNNIPPQKLDNVKEKLANEEDITKVLYAHGQNISIMKNDETKDLQLIVVANDASINNFITLRNSKTKDSYELNDAGVIITERLAKILNIKKGDSITIKNEDDIEKEVLVFAITEHYISHYMYMTNSCYQKLFGETVSINLALIKTDNLSLSDEQALSKALLKNDAIASVSMFSDSTPQLDKTMESLDLVVVVLIISAGLLTFVVLYSLANVNISERIRELATLKVLGFYDGEVDNYVSRESIILTILGILIGLGLGYYLTSYILTTVEQEFVMYPQIIKPISYGYAILIVVIFSFIVNIFSHFVLKKINMIESLKSVE